MNTFNRLLLLSTHIVPTAIVALFFGLSCQAQNFVYTNNNNYFAANTVSAFLVKMNGTVEQVNGSPFQTGGEGNGGNGYISSDRIAVCKKFLYATNDFSGTVSGFYVNPFQGRLKTVVGSPFTVNGADSEGIPLAITPDCKLLFAGDPNFNKVYAFHISLDGTLRPVTGSPFSVPSNLETIKLTNDNKFLAVAMEFVGVGMYSVASNGSLQAVPGSPFPASQIFGFGDMQIDCTNSVLYLPEDSSTIDIFSVASNGALALIKGSPFSSPTSGNSVPVLSPNGKFLFVSDEQSGVDSFGVLGAGGISTIAGSPFYDQLLASSGLSINKAGTLLYVADFESRTTEFSVMNVKRNGTLTLAPGSPVSTGQDGGMFSLAAYPPKACGTGDSVKHLGAGSE